MTVNLSDLAPPDIIETLDYEDILERMKQDLIARDPEFVHLLESDPAMKVMEVAAWRELVIRQRVNDGTRANLLAFAGGDDIALRRRIQEKITGWSTAGSRAHYRFHALSSDVRVRDARADSPEPGRVRVSVLSSEGSGFPSDELLQAVRDRVASEEIRVLTDTVEVVACGVIYVDVIANIYLYPETQVQLMDTIRAKFLEDFDTTRGLGWDLTRSWIIAHMFLEGVQRVELESPMDNIIADENACVALNSLTINLAGRDR